MEEQNNNGQLQIELKEEVALGTYSNLAIITPFKFRVHARFYTCDA